jgi:5-formyltetrahydrofolate cyclo-ligase
MDKQTFRKACLKCLKASSLRVNRYAKDKKISQKLAKILEKEQPKSILFYLPLSIEVNLKMLMLQMKKKCKIFVPFIVEESFKMVEYRLPLEKNSFGIFEPKAHNLTLTQKNIDLIIVPIVGMDKNRQRVGFGKGMYDRFYEKLSPKPIVVFVQREGCVSRDKLCDSYDIQCDYYVTSKETIID